MFDSIVKGGFKIITLTQDEINKLRFGIPTSTGLICICAQCNEYIEGTNYYIGVLNDVMCEACCNAYVTSNTMYKEDRLFEQNNIDRIFERLTETY